MPGSCLALFDVGSGLTERRPSDLDSDRAVHSEGWIKREGKMIARIWHGIVPTSKAGDHLEKMYTIALPEYEATEGNRGAWCLQRAEGSLTHFLMISHWEDSDSIKRFAGEDYFKAKYYAFDREYLIEMEQKVEHYDVRGTSAR